MTCPVIVLGGGGHAKVVLDALFSMQATVMGFTDPDTEKQALLGVPYLGADEVVLQHDAQKIQLVNGLGSVGATTRRRQLYDWFKERGFKFMTVVHASAVLGTDVQLAEGVQVMAGAVIQPSCRIGPNTLLNTRAAVDHDSVIGAHVHIAPGVTLSGQVAVGDRTHIGTGASIIQNVSIGSDCIVGAGALVLRDVGAHQTVVGVPAKAVAR